jgi:hypothetical protein
LPIWERLAGQLLAITISEQNMRFWTFFGLFCKEPPSRRLSRGRLLNIQQPLDSLFSPDTLLLSFVFRNASGLKPMAVKLRQA